MSLTVSSDLHFLPLNSELTFSCCQFSTFQLFHICNYSYGKIMVEHSPLVCQLCPCLCKGEETQPKKGGEHSGPQLILCITMQSVHCLAALFFLLLLRLSSPACLCSCVLSPEDSFLEHRFGGAVKVCIFNCCLGRISERRRCNEGNGTEEEERFTELTCTIPAPQTGMVKQKSAHEFELWLSRAKQEQSHGQVGLVVWERCAASTWQ